MDDSVNIVASGYDAFYTTWDQSPTLSALWREHVTGPDFPEEYQHISFLRLRELEALCDVLDLSRGATLADLACGSGGPGLWVAKRCEARLIGIDASAVAVQRATERARGLGMAASAAFRLGTFADTGLDAASIDGVISVDAIQYSPDVARAFAEIARIIRPGGTLAFVAFELDAERVAGLPVWCDPVGDYTPFLASAGFEILQYDQLPGWRDQVMAGFSEVIAAQSALRAELGLEAAEALVAEATITVELQPYSGHVLAVARRP